LKIFAREIQITSDNLPNSKLHFFVFQVDNLEKLKAKSIPELPWAGPECSRSFSHPDFKTVGTWSWEASQPYTQAAFTPPPQKIYLVLVSVRGP